MDKGLKFFKEQLEKALESSVCESCLKIVPNIEVERNAGICAHCAIYGEKEK